MVSIGEVEKALQNLILDTERERQEWERRQTEAAEAEAYVRKLNVDLTAFQTTLQRYREKMGKLMPALEVDLTRLQLNDKTLRDCCYEILSQRGNSCKVTEVMNILRAAGKLSGAKNYKVAYTQVYIAMDRDERFVRIGSGQFALAETIKEE